MKERYTVEIGGVELSIVTEESQEYVLGLAKLIDSRMKQIVMTSKRCTKTEAVMFCALDYLDDNLKTRLRSDELREENEALKEENESLKAQLAEIRQKYLTKP
jgi:cell division protein ZapA (FtsZ GTPase activity inhibitor)